MQEFLDNEKWYYSRGTTTWNLPCLLTPIRPPSLLSGIPYRRGYLLFGPPVSSACTATIWTVLSILHRAVGESWAGVKLHVVDQLHDFQEDVLYYCRSRRIANGCEKIECLTLSVTSYSVGVQTICMLSMTSSSITDERLLSLMSSAPKHSIILIEDIDAVFDSDEDANDPKRSQSPARGSTATAPFGQGTSLCGLWVGVAIELYPLRKHWAFFRFRRGCGS